MLFSKRCQLFFNVPCTTDHFETSKNKTCRKEQAPDSEKQLTNDEWHREIGFDDPGDFCKQDNGKMYRYDNDEKARIL